MEWIKVTVTEITNWQEVGFFGFEVEGNLFQKVGKRSASEMLFIAEQVVGFFGIGLPIVHDWRVCFLPIVGNKNFNSLGVFEEKMAQCKQNKRVIFYQITESYILRASQGSFTNLICRVQPHIYVGST